MTAPPAIVPVLITFNRPETLRATLEAFSRSAFAQGGFIVLDNASPPETGEVVRSFMAAWPGLRYMRNPYNIGGAANILRAVEVTDSAYLWVIGDDDRWFLDDLEELVRVLDLGTADLIRLGWLVTEESRGTTRSARDLADTEPMFFAGLSMISATIVRRELFIRYLPVAYSATTDAYPQLTPILRAFSEGELEVYTVTRNLMVHTPATTPGYFMNDLEWLSCWFRNSRFLTEPQDRARFVDNIMCYLQSRTPFGMPECLYIFQGAFLFKGYGISQLKYLLAMLAYGDGRRMAVFLAILLYGLLPGRLALWWDERNRKRLGLPCGNARAAFAARSRNRYARL